MIAERMVLKEVAVSWELIVLRVQSSTNLLSKANAWLCGQTYGLTVVVSGALKTRRDRAITCIFGERTRS